MILTTHLLAGAAIASNVQPLSLALILALLSHFFLDFLPHEEYPFRNIQEKRWGKSLPDFLKIGADFSLGILLILLFSKNTPLIFAGAFFAVLADGLVFLNLIFPTGLLQRIDNFHQKIHFPEQKRIPVFWGILSQLAVIVLAVFLLS